MNLISPRDLSFPNGPEFKAGDPVDVAALAAALGRTDADVLGDDLLSQGWPEGSAKEPTVAEILEAVGDDPELAAEALAAEQLRPSPRKGLVKKLEAVIEAAQTSPAPAGDDTPDEGEKGKL